MPSMYKMVCVWGGGGDKKKKIKMSKHYLVYNAMYYL